MLSSPQVNAFPDFNKNQKTSYLGWYFHCDQHQYHEITLTMNSFYYLRCFQAYKSTLFPAFLIKAKRHCLDWQCDHHQYHEITLTMNSFYYLRRFRAYKAKRHHVLTGNVTTTNINDVFLETCDIPCSCTWLIDSNMLHIGESCALGVSVGQVFTAAILAGDYR